MDKTLSSVEGMLLDQVFFERKPSQISYALNANIQSKDGNGITYTNEMSNQLCVSFPDGFQVVGVHTILELNWVIFALANPVTGESQIGKVINFNCNNLTAENTIYNCSCIQGEKLDSQVVTLDSCCTYTPIVKPNCLNFKISNPVRMVHKNTNCGLTLYIVDDLNAPRYIDLTLDPNSDHPFGLDSCGDPITEDDWCSRINIFKEFCIPRIQAQSVDGGGNLQAGTYQGLIAYTDIKGREYTDYFDSTNPVPIFDRAITQDTDYFTNKSIKFRIDHNTDLFEYFKFVIIKTVNETSEYIEAGTFKVSTPNVVSFTNNDKALVMTSLEKIRINKPVYTKAKFIEASSSHLLLTDLEANPDYNLQPFTNQLKFFWETVEIPYNSRNNYYNPIVAANFRGYMRDEVYPIGIRYKLTKTGKWTKAYHAPNRLIDSIPGIPDSQIVDTNNKDNIQRQDCDPPSNQPYWKVYNTAKNLGGFPPAITQDGDQICDIRQNERGEFAYWESTELYPCDERIWGDLAGKPIRYHKFPDCVVTHIHDSWNQNLLERFQYDINHPSFIYPIGIRLDDTTFNSLLVNTFVFNPETQKEDIPLSDLICGFEIVRGNRVGHKSIDAKGLLFDVGRAQEYDGNTLYKQYFYPNYPYNDIREDFYLSNNRAIYNSPDPDDPTEAQYRINPYFDSRYETSEKFRRFTFHGPDVHFQHPSLGTELKLETLEFGVQEGHFVEVQQHPRYKFLTKFDSVLAASLGSLAAIHIESEEETDLGLNASENAKSKISFNYADLMATSNQVRDLLEKVIPRRNFAYQYNSRGVYNNFIPVQNGIGKKIRSLELARYLSPNNQDVGDIFPVNNYGRESSVYLKVTDNFNGTLNPYPRGEASKFTITSQVNSQDILSSPSDWCKHPDQTRQSKIRSWYAAIKREVPDQYGNIDNISYVSTGYNVTLKDGKYIPTFYPAFGGDTFIGRESFKIKMPFFTQNMVTKPDGTDFDYDLVPNVAFPTYYIGTSPDELTLKNIISATDAALIIGGIAGLVIANGVFAPGLGAVDKAINAASIVALSAAGIDIYLKLLNAFIAKNNLDCDTTPANFDPTSLSDLVNLPQGTIFYQSGKFYLFNYGIPSFFVESDINLELRHGRNLLEENFYPNVGSGIPDDWLQEYKVPILNDNHYSYNATYSIQNYQEFIESFNNYNFDKLCQTEFPNRLIYSEKSNNEENFDNWLKYAVNNYYDFDKTLGKIVGVNSLDNGRILVRFENGFQIFNTRITIASTSPLEVNLSNSGMFGQEPLEFQRTYTGYSGSQHIAFEKTKVGYFWVDARRGQVFRFTDSVEEISRPNYNWFKENLPFKILKDFPDVDIDNSFRDIGISVCWDERFERLFITKLDYELLPEWKGKVFSQDGGIFILDLDVVKPVDLKDPKYFANRSFTIAWSPIIKNWVSFYSFLPNYYVSHPTHFQTGIHNTLWNHNLSNLSYQVYYNTLYPYILEYPVGNVPQSEILKSLAVNCEILKYNSETDFYSLKSVNKENYNIFFTKAIIYNKEQCTGTLTLTETPINDLKTRQSYPIFNTDNINILFSKNDDYCSFNNFYDITRNYENSQPVFVRDWTSIQNFYPIDKVLNNNDLNYTNTLKKIPIRSDECYIRLIQDQHQRYKFINNLTIATQEPFKNRR